MPSKKTDVTVQLVKYQKKELELKALLEITQAINENKSAAVLFDIFKFTCLVHLNIKSILLYMSNHDHFEKKISHGIKSKVPDVILSEKINFDKSGGELNIEVGEGFSFTELESYLPVFHKEKMLAILFLKKKDEKEEIKDKNRPNLETMGKIPPLSLGRSLLHHN